MSTDVPTKSELKRMKKTDLVHLSTTLNPTAMGGTKDEIYRQVYEHFYGTGTQSTDTDTEAATQETNRDTDDIPERVDAAEVTQNTDLQTQLLILKLQMEDRKLERQEQIRKEEAQRQEQIRKEEIQRQREERERQRD